MKIPFKYLPASWGLKGKTRAIAQAEYELIGYELERRLLEINHSDDQQALNLGLLKLRHKYAEIPSMVYREEVARLTLTGLALDQELLDIRKEFHGITDHEYQKQNAELNLSGDELTQELLRIKWVHDEISELEYKTAIVKLMVVDPVDQQLELNEIHRDLGVQTELEFNKNRATIMNEPYVAVINSNFKPEDKLDGLYFEFDWNDIWIEELKAAGYQGFTDDQIVQRWFEDLCRGVVTESDEQDDGQPIPFNSGRTINKVRRDGGPTEYS